MLGMMAPPVVEISWQLARVRGPGIMPDLMACLMTRSSRGWALAAPKHIVYPQSRRRSWPNLPCAEHALLDGEVREPIESRRVVPAQMRMRVDQTAHECLLAVSLDHEVSSSGVKSNVPTFWMRSSSIEDITKVRVCSCGIERC